jgi:hypothetical protein
MVFNSYSYICLNVYIKAAIRRADGFKPVPVAAGTGGSGSCKPFSETEKKPVVLSAALNFAIMYFCTYKSVYLVEKQ